MFFYTTYVEIVNNINCIILYYNLDNNYFEIIIQKIVFKLF